MIADHQANVISISDLLEGRFPAFVDGHRPTLTEYRIPLRDIYGSKDIGCRDSEPVRIAPGNSSGTAMPRTTSGVLLVTVVPSLNETLLRNAKQGP